MSMSVPPADYDLLGGHFDLTSGFKPEPPPYLPEPLLPGYKLKDVRLKPPPQLLIVHNRFPFAAHVTESPPPCIR